MFKELQEYLDITKMNSSPNTFLSYKQALIPFMSHFNISHLSDFKNLTSEDIQNYLFVLSDNKNAKNPETAKNTANAKYRVIKAFCNWLSDKGYIDNSPCKGVKRFKEAKILKVYLTREEQDKMILSCKSIRDRIIISLPLYTGIRVGELVKIKRKDIVGNHLLIHGKGRKERKVIINGYVMDLIHKYLESRNDNCEYLLVSKKGFGDLAGTVHGLSTEAVRHLTKKYAELAGIDEERIDKIAPHTFRRTFAIRLTKDYKASAFQIQKAMGHSSIRTTELYLNSAGSEIADDVMMEQDAPVMEA